MPNTLMHILILLLVFCSTTLSQLCVPGQYELKRTCYACPAGFYCPNGVTTTRCPTGSTSNTGATQCLCANGTYMSTASTCITCPTTSTCTNNTATPCTGDKVVINNTCVCVVPATVTTTDMCECPNNMYMENKACLACPSGYNSTIGTRGVQNCFIFQGIEVFVDVSNINVSQNVSNLSINSSTVQIVLNLCPVGYYCPPDSVDPTPCPIGTFSPDPGATNVSACAPCPIGHICSTPATSTPIMCTPGTFHPTDLSSPETCFACQIGSYSLDAARTMPCPLCPTNSFCETPTTISPCPNHTWSNAGAASQLHCRCNAGYTCNYVKRVHVIVTLFVTKADFDNDVNGVKSQLIADLAAAAGVQPADVVIDRVVFKKAGGARRSATLAVHVMLPPNARLRRALILAYKIVVVQ